MPKKQGVESDVESDFVVYPRSEHTVSRAQISDNALKVLYRLKSNGYQSIHTVILFAGKRVEVQIRTEKMDEFAEQGLAAFRRT